MSTRPLLSDETPLQTPSPSFTFSHVNYPPQRSPSLSIPYTDTLPLRPPRSPRRLVLSRLRSPSPLSDMSITTHGYETELQQLHRSPTWGYGTTARRRTTSENRSRSLSVRSLPDTARTSGVDEAALSFIALDLASGHPTTGAQGSRHSSELSHRLLKGRTWYQQQFLTSIPPATKTDGDPPPDPPELMVTRASAVYDGRPESDTLDKNSGGALHPFAAVQAIMEHGSRPFSPGRLTALEKGKGRASPAPSVGRQPSPRRGMVGQSTFISEQRCSPALIRSARLASNTSLPSLKGSLRPQKPDLPRVNPKASAHSSFFRPAPHSPSKSPRTPVRYGSAPQPGEQDTERKSETVFRR